MIIVKNRELLIPNNERYIGTTYDNDTENRVFQVPRFSQRGVDLANLTFRLDIQYANESYDTVVLDKEVGEAFVILIWRITSATLQIPGTLYIGLRAIDDEATVKWSSFSAAMYAERHLNTPGNYGGSLTEIEQMEQDHQYMKGVVDELKANIDYAHDAEAWAKGTRSGSAVPSTDPTYHNNSKYYSDQASTKATQAANSATAAANSATQAAETVSDTNARFNNAVSAVTSETEVIDARVGADGTTYPVLKTRLDTEHTQLKNALSGFENALGYVEGYTASKELDGLAPYYVEIKRGMLLKAGVVYDVEANLSAATSNNPVYFYIRDNADTNILSKAFTIGSTNISGTVSVTEDTLVKAVAWAKVDTPTISFSITPPTYELKIEDIQKEQTAFFSNDVSENIFDKDASDIVTGKRVEVSGANIGVLVDNAYCFTAYISIEAGTYCWLGLTGVYGASAARIAGFDVNKQYVKYITGTATGQTAPTNTTVYRHAFTDSELDGVAYLGYVGYLTMRDTLMFAKSNAYPSEYVPYLNEWTIPDLTVYTDQIPDIDEKVSEFISGVKSLVSNILYHKTIVFDGDSICNANSEIDEADPDGNVGNADNRGWCYRVGYPNDMTYHNLGRGGGTIAYVASNRHCISRDIDTIHTTYPDLDYLILEGGTNDADLLSDDQIGAMSATDYSGNYDDTTFIGALETLFYKAENYYPHARIGFIVAQKMGGVQYASSRARRYLFFEKAMEVCKKWGIPYINLWDDTILNPMFVPMYDPQKTAQENREAGSLYIDGQHLTADGYDAISPKIASWIRSL